MLALIYVLFALIVVLPVGTAVCYACGYTFELANYSASSIITALAAVGAAGMSSAVKEPLESRLAEVMVSLMVPLSLVNSVCYIFASSKIWVAAGMWICAGCCMYLAVRHGGSRSIKIMGMGLAVLMAVPVAFFTFSALTFGNIGQNTVVQSVESPNKTFYAKVIDSDQGALGGDTLVDVYENCEVDVLLFKIAKKPQRVYWGEWGEFEDMEIYWKDEKCLVINSVEYVIE